jgi:citrate synthase
MPLRHAFWGRNMTARETAKLTLDGKTFELPLVSASMGPRALDIRQLYAQADKFTFDPGFMSTAACQSSITYVDGEAGVLLYRGYPIEQLIRRCSFAEVAHLLLHGELPNAAQMETFSRTLKQQAMVHEQLARFYSGFRRDAHPMALLVGVVGALSAFYHEAMDWSDQAHRELSAHSLIAKMPAIVAMAYKYGEGQPFMQPRSDLDYAGSFMHMMFATPCEPYEPDPLLVRALDRILIVHADHEQGAATSTVRLAGSSGANPFACVAAGLACLWGPTHGGAAETVLNMLEQIGSPARIGEFIGRAKDKQDGFRLSGFGHRIYKSYDPRAKLIRETCHEVFAARGTENDKLLELALELERIALEDDYFVTRKLYPNVDFYLGILQRALGIPNSMITAVFAMARTVGWLSHWMEMIADPALKIGRPRQLFVGARPRDVVPLYKR